MLKNLFHSRAPGILVVVAWMAGASELRAGGLPGPSREAVDAAIATQLISYRRDFAGGAHTNGSLYGGASIALAVASHAGDQRADARLLEQIRHTLTPGREPTSNGGYPAQHERHVTGMFAIVRHTPRIWDQLTGAEKARTDTLMKASLVACAFTTSDENPFIKAGSQQYTLDGDKNLSRNWNPNYREGMIGGVLVGMVYFGGPEQTTALLAGYDHAKFVAGLQANQFPNIHETFNWKTANPSSDAPDAAAIEAAVRNYRYFGAGFDRYLEIYKALVTHTYGRNVNPGLKNGEGINGAGKIVAGADALPNKGAAGMLMEFDAVDANGPRSSFRYAFDGYRPHLTNQLVLIVGGYWPKGSAMADDAVARMTIGNTDLWYKAEMGYVGYAKGRAQTLIDYPTSAGRFGFVYARSLWQDVLQPYHGCHAAGGAPPAGGLPAGTRIETIAPARIRAGAGDGAAMVGTAPAKALGTILEGPVSGPGGDWWRIHFDGGRIGWIARPEFAAAPSGDFLTAAAGEWRNHGLPIQNGSFMISFNLRPHASAIDGLAGLSSGPAGAYGDLATAIRCAPNGRFDARSGDGFAALNPLAYEAGATYRVLLGVNMTAGTYSARVTPPGGAPVVIARDFPFRTEQAGADSLANIAVTAQTGSITLSGITVNGLVRPGAPAGLRTTR
jgi:hypothetical protein